MTGKDPQGHDWTGEHPHRQHCRSALDALDAVIEGDADRHHDELTRATRCLVHMRDHLVEEVRTGHPAMRARLDDVNSVLSVMASGQYPVVGIAKQRIQAARDHLERLLDKT